MRALIWPVTILLALALAAISSILIFGNVLGIDPEVRALTMQIAKGAASGLGAVFFAVLAWASRDNDGDGEIDGLQWIRKLFGKAKDKGGPAAVLVALLLGGSLASGCGASQLAMQGRAALVTTSVVHVAGAGSAEARTAALDRVEAEHPTDPEHDEALRAESARWRPLTLALDEATDVVRAWADALELARAAGDDTLALASVLPLAQRAVSLVSRALALARSLGVEVAGLPAWLTALLGGE